MPSPQPRPHPIDDNARVGRLIHRARRTIDATDSPYRGADWPLLPVLAALAIAWVALSWPWLSGRWTIPWDAKAHFLPQMQFLAQSLASGESPFWAPYVFSGHPQIADPQSLIFSPPFLTLAALDPNPGLRAADAAVLAAVLAGMIAVVVWFRDQGWHWPGALVAALGFGFGAAMAWRIQHIGQVLSIVYMMIAWVLLDRALQRGSLLSGLLAGIVAGFMVLGRDQVALLGLYLLAALAVWRLLGGGRPTDTPTPQLATQLARRLAALGAGGIGGLAVIILPVVLTLLVAEQSNRPSIDLEGAGRGSLHPAQLLTLIAADLFQAAGEMRDYWGPPSLAWPTTGLYTAQNVGILYVGMPTLLALLVGLASGRLWRRDIRFVAIAALLLTVYALGWYTPAFAAVHAMLPGVDLFRRPADAVFPLGVLLSLAGGYVVHTMFMTDYDEATPLPLERWHWILVTAALAVAVTAALAIALHLDRVAWLARPLGQAAALALASVLALWIGVRIAPARPVQAGLLPVLVLVGDLALNNGAPTTSTTLPPQTYDVLRPDTANETIALLKTRVAATRSDTRRDRVELVGLGFHWPNASLTHRLENTLGYNPVRLGHYTRATGAEDHAALPDQRRFAPLFPGYTSPLSNLLGLRFIAAGAPIETIDKTLRPGDLTLIARTPDGYVYENPRALPRVLFATSAVPGDFEAMLKTGVWPTTDLSTTVVLDETAIAPGPTRRPGTVRILSYGHTAVSLAVDSPDGGHVVLNDVWHPWWQGEIDGKPAQVLRANAIFRAIRVPPGRHNVRFVFRPITGALEMLTARLTVSRPSIWPFHD